MLCMIIWIIARVTIMQWFVYDNIYGRFIIKILKCGISIKLEYLMTLPIYYYYYY